MVGVVLSQHLTQDLVFRFLSYFLHIDVLACQEWNILSSLGFSTSLITRVFLFVTSHSLTPSFLHSRVILR